NRGNNLKMEEKKLLQCKNVIVCGRQANLRHCETEVTRTGYGSLTQSGNLRERARVLWSEHAISDTTRANLGGCTESTSALNFRWPRQPGQNPHHRRPSLPRAKRILNSQQIVLRIQLRPITPLQGFRNSQ